MVLLLHGFPTSSSQYGELIPRIADQYRVIAPDLPGFGFTEVPEERHYKYTFDALQLKRHALPVGIERKPTRTVGNSIPDLSVSGRRLRSQISVSLARTRSRM